MNLGLLDVGAVALGGSLGAVTRYLITAAMTDSPLAKATQMVAQVVGGGAAFGTTLANLTGCFALGLLFQYSESFANNPQEAINPRLLLCLRVGFLGSLTTFSTWMGEMTLMGHQGRAAASLGLLSINLVGGCLLFLIAIAAVRGVTS